MIWCSQVSKHKELQEYILDYIETTENKDIDYEKVSVSDYHSQNPYDLEQKALQKKAWLNGKNVPSCENDADKWKPDWGRLTPRYAVMDDDESNLHLGPIPYKNPPLYQEKVVKAIHENLYIALDGMKCFEYKISNMWFHQYNKGSFFDWHTHPQSNYSAVYYVELPSNELVTEIYGVKHLTPQEGDLLIFPGFLPHRSPINNTDSRKTIISFNFDVNCSPTDFPDWEGRKKEFKSMIDSRLNQQEK